MSLTVEQLREKAIAEEGYCDLGDGELQDIIDDLDRSQKQAQQDSASLQLLEKHCKVIDSLARRVEKMAESGMVNVSVDSGPMRKVCDALAFSVSSMHERVEKSIKQNEETMNSVSKALNAVADKLDKVLSPKHEVNVAAPNVTFEAKELVEVAKAIRDRKADTQVHKVAAPVTNINMNPVAQAIREVLVDLASKVPVVNINGPDWEKFAEIIETALLKAVEAVVPIRSVMLVERDANNQITGSITEHEYRR